MSQTSEHPSAVSEVVSDFPEIDVEYNSDGSITFKDENLTLRPMPGAGPLMQLPADSFESESDISVVTPTGMRVRVNARRILQAASALALVLATLWR